jgi:hypothetical protein
MTIRQFSAHWNPDQDRIFLRFNTQQHEEYCLWLTRTMVKRLFCQAGEYISRELSKKYDERVAALVKDFQKEKVNQKMNSGQSFQKGLRRPLGNEAALVIDIKLFFKKE